MFVAGKGRPELPDEERRDQRVNFMARQDEHEAYKRAAAQDDKTLAEWIRAVLNRSVSRKKLK